MFIVIKLIDVKENKLYQSLRFKLYNVKKEYYLLNKEVNRLKNEYLIKLNKLRKLHKDVEDHARIFKALKNNL